MTNEFNLELAREIKKSLDGKDHIEFYDIIQSYAKKDLYTTTTYMYWNTAYPVLSLIDALGYDTKSSSYLKDNGLINSIKHRIICSKCHESNEATVKTRNELNRLKEYPESYVCLKCDPMPGKYKPKNKPVQGRENLDITYDEYLKTEHWTKMRNKTLGIAGFKCQLCSSKVNLRAHHNNYNNLWNETVKDLVCLCDQCHHLFHSSMPCPK